MGLFSVPSDSEQGQADDARRMEPFSVRFRLVVRAAIRNTRGELASARRQAKLAAIAATNDARIVGILLILAALALGVEMAASFHLL